MHTPLCRHAVGQPVEYAAAAVAAGLDEIGFSDHSPMERDDFDNWRMFASQLDTYVASVEEARRRFPQLKIRLALEVDYLPGQEDWIRHLASLHPWDYLIGSVHYLAQDWDFDNPEKLSRWKERDVWETWSLYYDRLAQSARSGLFDIIGHADLCKKFCFRPEQNPSPLYTRFLNAAAASDVAIELNTAGLRKDCREIYPCLEILQLARARDIPVTFGSDAHAPGEVGADFPAALALAQKAGFTEYLRFEQRKRTVHALV